MAPLAAGGLAFWRDVRLESPGALATAVALLAGALIGVFAQLASWRGRLTERNRPGEKVARAAIDEAVAHTLVASLVAFVVAILLAALENITPAEVSPLPGAVAPQGAVEVATGLAWTIRGTTALTLALATYLAVLFVLTVNLLWDAYERASMPDAEPWVPPAGPPGGRPATSP